MLLREHTARAMGASARGCEKGVDEVETLRDALLDDGSDLGGITRGLGHAITVRRMRHRRQVAWPLTAIATVTVLLAGCSVAPGPPTPAQPAGVPSDPESLATFYGQDVTWVNCGAAECATLTAPLDYEDPTGPTVELALTRVAATGERLGSLFVNPGGPGGSAVDYAKAADVIVGDDVREHFDIVGLDPRGVGYGDLVECLTDAQLDDLAALEGTPDSPAEEQAVVEASRLPGAGCAAGSPDLIGHVGTVDSARDLDIARAVVGDDVLNYLGKSYGTKLGATYAELYPQRVGRMVLDGALPASLDLVEVTRDQAIGFEGAVRDFAADCVQLDDCPLQGDADQATAQLRGWFDALDSNPLPAGDRDLTGALASYAVLINLYVPDYDYDRLRPALARAMEDDDPTELLALLDSRISRGSDGRYEDNSSEAFYAITCLDQPFTGSVEQVRELSEEWGALAPTFGPSLAWSLLTCADWPATADVLRDTPAVGSNPILVVSGLHDPATPHAWGERLAAELSNGHLLTWTGRAHTAYGSGSACIDDAVDAYLTRGSLPAAEAVCD